MSHLYQQTLSQWMEKEASELSSQKLRVLFRNQLDDLHNMDESFQDFLSFCQENHLIDQNEQGYFLTRKGVRFQEESFNLSKEEVVQGHSDLIAKVQSWNTVAQQHNLPQIAVLLGYGSTIKQEKDVFGDIDVIIAWRNTPDPSPISAMKSQQHMFGALSVLSGLPQNPSSWDVEDRVEHWLEQTRGVRLSSVDVLDTIAHDEPFSGKILYQNTDLSEEGVLRQEERQTLLSFAHMIAPSSNHFPKSSLSLF